jgi:predicted DNA-binding protein
MAAEPTIPLSYRVPVRLRDELEKLAKADKRPLGQYLRIVLEEHVEQARKKAGKAR